MQHCTPVSYTHLQTDKLEGKHIVTVEGLSAFEKEAFTYAFGEAGACLLYTSSLVLKAAARAGERCKAETDGLAADAEKICGEAVGLGLATFTRCV